MVFSLSEAGEYQRKPFTGLKNAAASVALIKQCIKHTETVVEKSGLEVLWFDEHLQQGNTFAERYKNAVKSCFDLGYERVISIGNDAPDLTSDMLKLAAEKLLTNDLVIGPSQDGGVYLLGLNKQTFNEEEFVNFPWQEDTLNQAILSSAENQNKQVSTLDQLIDLDDAKSVAAYVSLRPDSAISKLIISFTFVTEQVTPLPRYFFVLPKVHVATVPFRGPPAAIIS